MEPTRRPLHSPPPERVNADGMPRPTPAARTIERYPPRVRINHWAVVLLFLCAALSGLAFFHPSLFFLSHLFGGGTWARVLHPFFGVLMVAGFVLLAAHVWRDNRLDAGDRAWLRRSRDLIAGREEQMPPVGKYNGGQKLVFWTFAISLLLLFVTGFVFWQPWFADAFPIPLRRVAVVIHSVAAVVLLLSMVIHVYAAIWVRGSMRAMLRGDVSEAWARQHHRRWSRQIAGGDPRGREPPHRGPAGSAAPQRPD